LRRGLAGLEDDELTALALNPIALRDLHDEISERLPDAWLRVMEREGLRLLGERERSVPPAIQSGGTTESLEDSS
jgi:hypothetical protein